MKGLENNAAELFRLMDRVRKAWQSVTPCEHQMCIRDRAWTRSSPANT